MERKTFLASGLTIAAAAALPNLGNLGRVSAASSQSTVTWWSWASVPLNPALTPAPGVSHNSTNDALKVLYEKAFPGRKIDDTTYPYPDYLTALKTAFAGGNEPDTLMLQPGALMSEYQPYLLPLETYCTKTWGHNYRKQFAPLGIRETLNADPAHKTLYGLPIGLFGGDALFYNKVIFKQYNLGIPQSYADLKSSADTLRRALSPAAGVAGAAVRLYRRQTLAGVSGPVRRSRYSALCIPSRRLSAYAGESKQTPQDSGPRKARRTGIRVMTNNADQRRRLRLGALLYRLRYYAMVEHRDEEGRITLYQHDPQRSVEIAGSAVRLIIGDQVEVLDLEAAIVRSKEALLGRPFHRVPSDGG